MMNSSDPPAHHAERRIEKCREIGARRARQAGLVGELLDEPQNVRSTGLRGHDARLAAREKERADAIPVTREDAGEDRGEVDEEVPLLRPAAVFRGFALSEIHRGADVQEEPRGDVTVLHEQPHPGLLHPGGHVPVDGPHVVGELVLPELRHLEPEAPEERPVVALEQSVEPPDDGPVEALEDAFGIR